MSSKEAAELVQKVFLTVKNSIWVSQYNFDSLGVCHMLNRGYTLEQIKSFIKYFNQGMKEKLVNSSNWEISKECFEGMKNACYLIIDK